MTKQDAAEPTSTYLAQDLSPSRLRRIAVVQISLLLGSVVILIVVWISILHLEARRRVLMQSLEQTNRTLKSTTDQLKSATDQLDDANHVLQIQNEKVRQAATALETSKQAISASQKLISDVAQTHALGSSMRAEAKKTLESGQAVERTVDATIRNVTHGFAFYGVYDGSGWREQYFEKVSGDRNSLPNKGDICRSKGDVNIRAGYIQFERFRWRNRPSTGILHAGEQVRVLDVKEVTSGYVWIELETVS